MLWIIINKSIYKDKKWTEKLKSIESRLMLCLTE